MLDAVKSRAVAIFLVFIFLFSRCPQTSSILVHLRLLLVSSFIYNVNTLRSILEFLAILLATFDNALVSENNTNRNTYPFVYSVLHLNSILVIVLD
jgi:hypothetical protein